LRNGPRPIVILNNEPPSDSDWEQLSYMKDIYYLSGYSTDTSDLDRAGVSHASNIIIFGESGDKTDLSIDASPIMTFRLVKLKKASTLVDLVYMSNGKFLGGVHPLGHKGEDLENAYYAAGQVYTSSNLDTLIAQAFYNKYIVQLISRLTEGQLFPIPIKEHASDYVGRTFLDIFNYFMVSELVAVSIYRKALSGRLRYLITNPATETVMMEDDIVFVLDQFRAISTQGKASPALTKQASKDAVERRKKNRKKKETTDDIELRTMEHAINTSPILVAPLGEKSTVRFD